MDYTNLFYEHMYHLYDNYNCTHLNNGYNMKNRNEYNLYISKFKDKKIYLDNVTDETDPLKSMYIIYILSLIRIFNIKLTNDLIYDLKNDPFMFLSNINYLYMVDKKHPASYESWGSVAWRLLFSLPVLWNSNNESYIRDVIIYLMPYVTLNCQEICKPHAISYMNKNPVHKISDATSLKNWLNNLKTSVQGNKKGE